MLEKLSKGSVRTADTQRHIQAQAVVAARAKSLSPTEIITISAGARQAAMRDQLAATGKIDHDAAKAIGHAAVEAARTARVGK
jgi:hypothetical protein